MKTLLADLGAAGYRVALEGETIRLHFEGDTDPDPAHVAPLIEELKNNKAAALAHLRQRAATAPPDGVAYNRFEGLKREIEQAADHVALAAIDGRIQDAFEAGDLSQEEAGGLAAVMVQEARTLPEADEDTPGLRLSELFAAGPVRRIRSAVLGEEVLFLADGAEEPEGHGLTVYRESELRRLVGMAPGQLKALHRTKVMFDGEVIDADRERAQ